MDKKYCLILSGIMFLTANCYAGQVKEVNHAQMITVDLSSKDPNIIAVDNDRIKQYSALKGIITANIDNETGIINLKPVATYDNRPFSLIIFTEKGYRYTLLANPKKIPAQDITLENREITLKKEGLLEDKSQTQNIALLVKGMIKNSEISGFNKIIVDKHSNLNNYFGSKNELQLQMLYKGDKRSGEVISFKNNTDQILKLKEHGFYSSNVLAVKLSDYEIQPGNITKIYRVVKNG